MGRMSQMAAENQQDADNGYVQLYGMMLDAYAEAKAAGLSEDALWAIAYSMGIQDPEREINLNIELPF